MQMGNSDKAEDANLLSLLLESVLLLCVLLQMVLSSIYGSMPLLPLLRVVSYSLHSLLQHNICFQAASYSSEWCSSLLSDVATDMTIMTRTCLLIPAVSRERDRKNNLSSALSL